MSVSRPAGRNDGSSRTHEVAAALRSRITHGELRAGMRLPSERALAAQLNVSRVTVVRALTRLRLEGLLVTRHGAGTFVAATDRLMDAVAAQPATAWQPVAPDAEAAIDLRWATTAGPVDLLKIAAAAVQHGLPAALAHDGTVADSGDELTRSLAEYLSATGLPTRAAQLTLTSGAMAGLQLVLDTVGPPGRLAIAETPSYPGALRILRQSRRRLLGWYAGTTGWDPDRLAYLIRPLPGGALYVQPDGHNPTGATMQAASREALGRLTRTAGWVTIADETMRPLHQAAQESRVHHRSRS
jgi:DNA-binding transcriptional MocR family regulator